MSILREICCPLLTSLVSGSPIIQGGKIIGAVTHVFVNDPTKGYGIFIENMLTADKKQLIKTTVLISCCVCYLKYSQAASAATAPNCSKCSSAFSYFEGYGSLT